MPTQTKIRPKEAKVKKEEIIADNWKCLTLIFTKEQIEKLKNRDIRTSFRQDMFNRVRISFDSIFWSFKEVKKISYPADWFDAFKLRYFPNWLLKRFPAKVTNIIIKEVVPQLPKSFKSKLYQEKKEIFVPEIKFEGYSFTEELEEKYINKRFKED